MGTLVRLGCLLFTGLLALPGAALAQGTASIAGVVKDTSGAVLPGVTVEAASDVLIEKTRTAVTDGSGLFNIIDLRPGTYVVTFTLTGFQTFKRDGLELPGGFTANVDATPQTPNNAGTTHTATSDTGAWDTGNLDPGATSSAVSFPTAGTFPYHCAIHPSMVGSVVVSAAAPAATNPPVQLARGGAGPEFPIGAVLVLLGAGLLAARGVRRHRTQSVGERIDKLPHQ